MRRSLILAALFAVLAVPAAASADTATVTTDGDSFVGNGNPNTNFGTSVNLRVRRTSSRDLQQTYVKFPAANVPAGATNVSGQLRVYAKEVSSKTVEARTTSDFSETGLTWNNRPAVSGVASSQTVNSSGYKTFNVPVDAQGRNAFSLTTPTVNSSNLAFDAREGTLGDAQLVITFTPPATDTTPPDTTITDHPANPTDSTDASFSFTSTESGSTFECQLGGSGYSACTSPKTYSGLRDGDMTFFVRATDAAGNTDPSPATFSWTIAPPAPAANFSISPNPAVRNTATTFTDTGTCAVTPCTYRWFHGDASSTEEIEAGAAQPNTTAEFTYTGPAGQRTMTERVTDSLGRQDTATKTFDLVDQPAQCAGWHRVWWVHRFASRDHRVRERGGHGRRWSRHGHARQLHP